MAVEQKRSQLLATTALALSVCVAAPAAAQVAAQETDATVKAETQVAGQGSTAALGANGGGSIRPFNPVSPTAAGGGGAIRPFNPIVAMGANGGGAIRPFAAGILPYAGNIRTFAGDISGSAGNIRTFQGDATASAGNIRTFAGNIRTFAGNIRTFSGDVSYDLSAGKDFWGKLTPLAGSLSASAGNIRTFAGEFEGMAGNIRTFAGNIRTFAGNIRTFEEAPGVYTDLTGAIRSLVDGSRDDFGAAVQARTGQSFDQAFASRMLGKYGIDLDNPSSLVGMDEVGYELFLMDWYDNLMLYSGQDQVDHWMKAVNWTPRLTQDLGSGKDSRIGLLDFTVTGDETSNIVKSGGIAGVSGIHGSAVVSLMVAKHEGRGVMGIAPGASVVAYNPFDATYTAGWTDIRNGVLDLVKNGATIINMSLGVPGYTLNPGWNDVFREKAVSDEAKKRVFVLAAGNEGITQTQNVEWDFGKNPNIIVVGSVDPSGNISEFSNRPGTVCLVKDGKCESQGNLLMNRFIVAPGEFILVSDGKGGVTRMSGTSFAAPLVSGTVALMHDRWPWLRDKPAATVSILLNAAKDIGAPGVDPVYGRGMLDVDKALSPEDFNQLKWKISINGSKLEDLKVGALTSTQREQMITYWEANKAYVTVFDETLDTYRDFSIPLSTKLAGLTVGNTTEQFNSYLTQRFFDWFRSGGTVASGKRFAFGPSGFSAAMPSVGGLAMTVTATPRPYTPGLKMSGAPFETGVELANVEKGVGFRFGEGRGGAALGGATGFALQSDYEVGVGGANPFLGLASGANYGAMDVALGDDVTITTGVTRQNARRNKDRMSVIDRIALGGVDPYKAMATNVTVQYRAAPWLTATVGYTMLDEELGLLGVQSLDRHDFAGGTTTDAGTVGADMALGKTFSVTTSATFGRTRAGKGNIAVGDEGLLSSSYQVALTKTGLFGNDRARLTLSQPLHTERGQLEVANVQVVNRQTGELGTVVQKFDIGGGDRRFVAEALYGRSVMDGKAEFNLFGRFNLRGDAGNMPSAIAGGSFRLAF